MSRDHSKLAPIIADFVPKGRTAQDVAMYKIMRRIARLNRKEIWEKSQAAMHELFMHGTSYVKVEWHE